MALLERRDYETAMHVQNACNLSGVVRSWAEMMPKIWAEANANSLGTDYVNCHPINVLFASKVASLTGCEMPLAFADAYSKVQRTIENAASAERKEVG